MRSRLLCRTLGLTALLVTGLLTGCDGQSKDGTGDCVASAEVCDTVDNDCDGVVDEDDAIGAPTWYIDADGDGFGADGAYNQTSCEQPAGYLADDSDCDDIDPDVHPGATEVCDGADNDCDASTDEDDAADAPTWYADADGDGFGDVDSTISSCEQPDGYSAIADDFFVEGSEEGEPIEGGGTSLTLADGNCFGLPVDDYAIVGYSHGDSVGGGRVHAGDDVYGPEDTPVYAIYDGEVVWAAEAGSWGTLVEVLHTSPDGIEFYTLYGHLGTDLEVGAGDPVSRGDTLGYTGNTSENGGWSEHLHYSIFTGTYPETGVLQGHVTSLTGYEDPIPWMDEHGVSGDCESTCDAPASPEDPAVSYSSADAWNYVTWDAVEGAEEYVVYWAVGSGVNESSATLSPTTTTEYGHSGVVDGYEYCYRIQAVNSCGESDLSEEACVTVDDSGCSAPGTPMNADANYSSSDEWNYITWDAVADADEYVVYWAVGSGVDSSSATLTPTTTTDYGHSGVVAGYEYCYRVSAENSCGASALSGEACATVPSSGGSAVDDDGDGYDTDSDCDDGDAAINPGADEVCDGADNDCDGDTDDDDSSLDSSTTTTWYDDDDGDGYGDASDDTDACDAPAGHVANNDDCDDTDGTVNPGAAEVCSNSTDDDCDGSTDEGCGSSSTDADGDGYDTSTDCDDSDSSVNPGTAEVCSNSVDDDCDGSTDEGCGSSSGTVELCVAIDSSSGYTCSDWVTAGAAVAGESCDLSSADDGELWVSTDGWDTSPVGTASGSFTEICATVSGSSGDILYVNGRFDNTLGQTPDYYYYTEWWWCANWYGDGATAGTFTVDGVEVTPTLYAPGTGGYDCLVEVP